LRRDLDERAVGFEAAVSRYQEIIG